MSKGSGWLPVATAINVVRWGISTRFLGMSFSVEIVESSCGLDRFGDNIWYCLPDCGIVRYCAFAVGISRQDCILKGPLTEI